MRIAVAQTRPVKGNIPTNISNHKKLIELAFAHEANTIIFPELSITGYEPTLAKELGTNENDNRFDDIQKLSDEKKMIIAVGMPLKRKEGICISMIIFKPKNPRQVYSKKYLHSDETPFFISGQNNSTFIDNTNMALSICYEISVPQHSENAFENGAKVYIASVAKSVAGVGKAVNTLSDIARKYSMIVFMSNCVGHCDNFDCGGKSSVWNNKGSLLGQLGDKSEGILIFDTETKELVEKINMK
jgi:predicted amidohydrolase